MAMEGQLTHAPRIPDGNGENIAYFKAVFGDGDMLLEAVKLWIGENEIEDEEEDEDGSGSGDEQESESVSEDDISVVWEYGIYVVEGVNEDGIGELDEAVWDWLGQVGDEEAREAKWVREKDEKEAIITEEKIQDVGVVGLDEAQDHENAQRGKAKPNEVGAGRLDSDQEHEDEDEHEQREEGKHDDANVSGMDQDEHREHDAEDVESKEVKHEEIPGEEAQHDDGRYWGEILTEETIHSPVGQYTQIIWPRRRKSGWGFSLCRR